MQEQEGGARAGAPGARRGGYSPSPETKWWLPAVLLLLPLRCQGNICSARHAVLAPGYGAYSRYYPSCPTNHVGRRDPARAPGWHSGDLG
jgi:hypothetical protein